jgi:hypothetical protein
MNSMTSEIDAARAEITALRAENARLQARLERCQFLAASIVEAWNSYDELGKLKERIERAQWPTRKKKPNGHSSRPVADH